jgi:hypothetical protein
LTPSPSSIVASGIPMEADSVAGHDAMLCIRPASAIRQNGKLNGRPKFLAASAKILYYARAFDGDFDNFI